MHQTSNKLDENEYIFQIYKMLAPFSPFSIKNN